MLLNNDAILLGGLIVIFNRRKMEKIKFSPLKNYLIRAESSEVVKLTFKLRVE
jgi:hypothetical protein